MGICFFTHAMTAMMPPAGSPLMMAPARSRYALPSCWRSRNYPSGPSKSTA
jgi:hypothetical protein